MSVRSLPGGVEAAERLILCAEAALADEDFDKALALLHEAEVAGVEPDRCAGNRWLAYMLRGDFPAAWRESDRIRLRGLPDPHRFWQGEEVAGKRVILRCLHGFGDSVQMLRFLPRLRAQVSHMIVEVPPRLLELAPYFDGMDEVITWGEQAPAKPPAWDVQLEIMELPYLLRVSSGDLEPRQGYLRLPETLLAATSRVLGPKRRPRVGVVWAAGHWNPSRSIPSDLLRALADIEGCEFWSLQGEQQQHADAAMLALRWRDVYEAGDGILALAAVIRGMDLVVTVDTLAAHLAGALGVPCWLLLQHRADWRWMSRRGDSPWYASLRLMRQSAADDWAGLLGQVSGQLKLWAADASRSC